jgi:hypothetical protein
LIATADKYFTGMQRNDGKGDYPFHERCDRIENGGRATNAPTPAGQTRPDPKTATGYSGQWTCREQFESGLLYFVSRIRDRRYVAVDQERGVVAVFAFFDHMAGSTRNFTRLDGSPITAGPAQPWTGRSSSSSRSRMASSPRSRRSSRARLMECSPGGARGRTVCPTRSRTSRDTANASPQGRAAEPLC